MLVNIAGDAYTTLSPAFSSQTCINFYAELANLKMIGYQQELRQPKYANYLVGTPGTEIFVALAQGPVRGLFTFNNVLYAVANNTFYSINTAGVQTSQGTLTTTSGPVQMCINFNNEILLVDGTNGYVYDIDADTFTQITDINYRSGAKTCSFQQGYAVINDDTIFALSNLNDFSNWDAIDQSAIGSYQDKIITTYWNHVSLELWVFCDQHTEVWYNAGTNPYPLAQRSTLGIDMGCAAPFSVYQLGNTLFWLSKDARGKAMVVMANGYTPTVISTDAINAALASYDVIDDAISYAYQEAGHTFYVLTFPTQDITWVFDLNTELWHQRSSVAHQGTDNSYNLPHRHISNCFVPFNGMNLVGDWFNGNIYKMALDIYTDNTDPILRERISCFQFNDLKQMSIYSYQVDAQTGVGTTTGQGANPQLLFSYSKDYGQTWISDQFMPLGKSGEFQTRCRVNSLGLSRTINFRHRISDPVSVRLMNSQVFLTQGSS